jgi:hypothetical protein
VNARPSSCAILLALLAGAWACRPDPPASPAPPPPPERAAPSPQASEPDAQSAEAAAAVIRAYYDAIDRHAFDEAYRLWAREGAASGKSYEAFAEGFAETESVRADVGPPSRIEGAAGSRYVTVPVAILATEAGGRTVRFAGTYTLRLSVVDGATPEQRTWHIDSARISPVGAE